MIIPNLHQPTNFLAILRVSLIICTLALASNAESPPLVESEPMLVPGTKGKFDLLKVDEQLHRLLANHTGNGTLDVFDLPDGKLRQSVPTGAPQDVAIDYERGKYYVTVSDRSDLAIVDRQTLTLADSVPLPAAPDGCAYDSKNRLVYVDRDNGEDVWVVDPSARRIVATIKVPKAPEAILYDPATDRIYQNIKSKPVTLSIDPAMNSVIETWSTVPAENLHGLAIDSKNHRLFPAGGNGKLSVLDSASGNVLSSAEIASGVDQIAYDPANNRIYCASGRSGLSVVEVTVSGVRLIGNIATPTGAHSVAVDPATHAVWIAYGRENESFLLKLSVPP
ncbi:MAG TPA: YncE family protein [Chthoniobacterales bacterium]|jgi:DNA-binding beta-propeller fold protein YncE|nr:YncE family protein [Chthoniobacterales bacterium]